MPYGINTHVAIAFQNSFDTSNVISLYHMQHLEESVGLNIPPLVDESGRGIFDEGDGYEGPKTVDGDLTINAKAIPLGVLLRGIYGDASVTAVDSLFAHSFKPRTADFDELSALDPLTYFKYYADGGSATLFYNLNLSMLELGVNNGEFLTAKATFIGGTFAQVADISASFPTGKRFTWDASSLQLGGAAFGDMKSLTITMDESLEAIHKLNTNAFPGSVKRSGQRSIAVAGTIEFNNQTEYQKFIAQTEQSFIASFAGPVDVGSGGKDQIVIDIPALRYTEFKPTAGGAGQINVDFTAAAKYKTTSATSIEITLTNTFAVY